MHFFSRLLAEADESVYSQVHAAPPSVAPFQVATWRRANPGLAFGLPALEVLKAEARLAKRDSAELATFRALRLNQGTSEIETQHLIRLCLKTLQGRRITSALSDEKGIFLAPVSANYSRIRRFQTEPSSEVWREAETDTLPPREGPCAWGAEMIFESFEW